MTAPTIEKLPVRVPGQTLSPDLVHVTCCRDDDPGEVALCGTDIAAEPWVSRAANATCLVCADLEDINCSRDNCGDICPRDRGAQ